MNTIFQTDPSFSFLVLRLGLGITFFAHGSQQLLGWFGGRGFNGTLSNWKQRYGIPAPLGMLAIFVEFFGSLALFVGFLTRPAALGLVAFMLVVMFTAHWKHGFFLARRGAGENGIEYSLALMIMALALVIGGGGALSIDRLLNG